MKVPCSLTHHRSFIHRTLAGAVLGARTGGLGSVTKDVQKANQRYSLVITSAPEAAQGRGDETEEGIVGTGGGGDLLGSECRWLPGLSQAESGCEGGRGCSRHTLHLCSSGPDFVQEGLPGCWWSQSSPCPLHRDSGPLRSTAPHLAGRERCLPCPVLKTRGGFQCRLLKEP